MKNLVCAVLFQALKDFAKGNEAQRKKILRELRGSWCDFISNGLSLVMADRLEKDPQPILDRIKYGDQEEELRNDLLMEQQEQM